MATNARQTLLQGMLILVAFLVLAAIWVSQYGVSVAWFKIDGIGLGMTREEAEVELTKHHVDEIQPRIGDTGTCDKVQSRQKWLTNFKDDNDAQRILDNATGWTYLRPDQTASVDICFANNRVSDVRWTPALVE